MSALKILMNNKKVNEMKHWHQRFLFWKEQKKIQEIFVNKIPSKKFVHAK